MIARINAFMNDPDKGPGHAHGNGLFYGVILLAFTPFPLWILITAMAANHLRVLYQELFIEGWANKPKLADFWYDSLFRPAVSDLVAIIPFVPMKYLPLLSLAILIVGYKAKNDWPLLISWGRK